MHRDEVECIVNFEQGTPKQDEVKAAIAKALAATPDLVVVNRFAQNFGAKQAKVLVCVYKSHPAMKKSVKEKKKKEEKKPAA
jgi:ribosomal protein S24E